MTQREFHLIIATISKDLTIRILSESVKMEKENEK